MQVTHSKDPRVKIASLKVSPTCEALWMHTDDFSNVPFSSMSSADTEIVFVSCFSKTSTYHRSQETSNMCGKES